VAGITAVTPALIGHYALVASDVRRGPWVVVLAVLVGVSATAIGWMTVRDDGSSADEIDAEDLRRVPADQRSAYIAEALGCENPQDVYQAVEAVKSIEGHLLRTGALAHTGTFCTHAGAVVEFYDNAQSRTDRLVAVLGIGAVPQGCEGWIALGRSWFAVSTDKGALIDAANHLGGQLEPVQPFDSPEGYEPLVCEGVA